MDEELETFILLTVGVCAVGVGISLMIIGALTVLNWFITWLL